MQQRAAGELGGRRVHCQGQNQAVPNRSTRLSGEALVSAAAPPAAASTIAAAAEALSPPPSTASAWREIRGESYYSASIPAPASPVVSPRDLHRSKRQPSSPRALRASVSSPRAASATVRPEASERLQEPVHKDCTDRKLQQQRLAKEAQLRQLEARAQEEVATHEQQRIAMERELQAAQEQRDRSKAHHERLSQQLEELHRENAELRRLRDQQGEDRQRLRASLGELSSRYEGLEAEHKALCDQPIWREHVASSKETQLQIREDELSDQVRRLEQRQQVLNSKEEQLVQMGRAASQLEESEAAAKKQQQEWEQQIERQQTRSEVNKENRRLNELVQEQKSLKICLGGQLERLRLAKSFTTPGQYLKAAKRHEGDGAAQEHAALKKRLSILDVEVAEAHRLNEALRRHMPRFAWEAVAEELRARPPGPPTPLAHGGPKKA